jgi:hypothetical protein
MRKFFGVSPVIAVVVGIALLCAGSVVLPFVSLIYEVQRFPQEAAEADDVVQAVYRYQIDHGLWPETLRDLVPAYLSQVPSEWEYRWYPYDSNTPTVDDSAEAWGPVLERFGPLHQRLRYQFPFDRSDDADAGWTCSMEGSPREVRAHPKVPDVGSPTKGECLRNALDEVNRRSKADPNNPGHARLKKILLKIQSQITSAANTDQPQSRPSADQPDG